MVKTPTKRVLIAGYYGFGNTGDEAILSGILHDLRQLNSELEFTVISGKLLDTAGRGCQTVDWKDLSGIVDAVKACDLLIVGGGGIINDLNGYWPEYMLAPNQDMNGLFLGLMILAALNDKPYIIYAIGVGPAYSDKLREHIRLGFTLANAATVRDTASMDLLKEIGCDSKHIRETADPAFMLVPASKKRAQEIIANTSSSLTRPIIGVALLPWSRGVDIDYWENKVAKALDEFGRKHKASLLFIPFYVEPHGELDDDIGYAERLMSHISSVPTTKLGREVTPEEKAAVIAECDLIVGMRHHSVVFSILAGIPCVAISCSLKVTFLMSKIGCQELVLDVKSITKGRLLELMNYAFDNRELLKKRVVQAREKLKSLAHENALLAMQLLDKPLTKPFSTSTFERFLGELVQHHVKVMAEYNHTIQELREELSHRISASQLAEKDNQYSQLSNQKQSLETQLLEKETIIASLKNELALVYSSRRWGLGTFIADKYWKMQRLLNFSWLRKPTKKR
jgi:polysaccharide pyruvyl transferase CsaB